MSLSEPVYRRTLYFYHGQDCEERQFQRHVYQQLDDEYFLCCETKHSVLQFRMGHSIRVLLEVLGVLQLLGVSRYRGYCTSYTAMG